MAYETKEGMYTVGDYGDLGQTEGAAQTFLQKYKWYLVGVAAVAAALVGYKQAKKRGWIGVSDYSDVGCGCD